MSLKVEETTKRHRSIRRIGLGLSLSMLVLWATACSAGAPEEQAEEKVTPVVVEVVDQRDLTVKEEIAGILMANADVTLLPKVSGTLTELFVKNGESVQAGQEIGQIDTEELQRSLDLEKSSLDLAQIEYDLAKSRDAQAQNTAKNELRAEGVAADQTRENLVQSQLSVKQAEQTLVQARLRYDQVQQQLEDAKLLAPISGEIYKVHVDEHELVSQQSAIVSIVNLDPIRIVSDVSIQQLQRYTLNQNVQVYIPELNKSVEGTIDFLSPVAGDGGLYTIEAEISNDDRTLKQGMIAKIQTDQVISSNALVVPTTSIVEKEGKSYVFAINKDTASEVAVKVLETQSEWSAIESSELKPGDQIAVKGQITLIDGAKVKIVEEDR